MTPPLVLKRLQSFGGMIWRQGSDSPVFREAGSGGPDYLCGSCRRVLAAEVPRDTFRDTAFRCYHCESLNASPPLDPYTPVAYKSVTGEAGEYLIEGTVKGQDVSIVSEAAIAAWEQRIREVESVLMGTPLPAPSPANRRRLVVDVVELVGRAGWTKVSSSHDLSLKSRTPTSNPHRLAELIARVDTRAQGVSGDSPMLTECFAELALHRNLFKLWRWDVLWPEIRSGFTNPDDYLHTVALLTVAGIATINRNPVRLLKDSAGRAADLRIDMGVGEYVPLEVKAPRALRYPSMPVTSLGATNIIEAAYKSAKGQITPRRPGVLAIVGFRLPESDLDVLEAAAEAMFAQKRRPHLAGIQLYSVSVASEYLPAGGFTSSSFIALRRADNLHSDGSVRMAVPEKPARGWTPG